MKIYIFAVARPKERLYMTRREERELLFSLIFEFSFNKREEYADIYENEKEFMDIESDYVEKGAKGITENLEAIDSEIMKFSKGWKLSRLSKVTLAIMRVAVYEMLYDKLAYNIVINEAVELAKKYDEEKAPKFINGILNNVAASAGLKDK